MHSEKIAADVELKGRELEAVEVALRQFRIAKFSTSGDLKHFTIELRRLQPTAGRCTEKVEG